MSCEKAEIQASKKFRAVEKLAQSTKIRQSYNVYSFIENRFDSRFLIGRNGFPTYEKVVLLLPLATRISEPGFQQYVWNKWNVTIANLFRTDPQQIRVDSCSWTHWLHHCMFRYLNRGCYHTRLYLRRKIIQGN